jgi:hypothetical protein
MHPTPPGTFPSGVQLRLHNTVPGPWTARLLLAVRTACSVPLTAATDAARHGPGRMSSEPCMQQQ